KALPAREVRDGVPVRRYVFRVPELNWRQFAGAAVWGPPTLLRIVRALRTHRAELIHIQCVSSNAYYALHASRLLHLPLVATLHGELSADAGGLFQHSAFARRLLRAVLERADAVTACSRHTLREAETFYGAPFGARAQAVHNGVRLEEFCNAEPYPHPRPYLLALGRHVRQKGFDILLRAYRLALHNGLARHDLLLAGDGPERESLARLSSALGLDGKVHFLGVADRAATARLFAGCAFFVLPSRIEPQGIVNLEAMASGKAVLAARVGGVPEAVTHGVTGLLVEPGDPQALAHCLVRLASDTPLCARLGAAGREAAARFNWPAVAATYARVYHSARPPAAPHPAP
ncbi:MAG: glycosyltransferase family 4 protein, partial [Chthoniobacteraceae bacterium]|nr:glycosyltransferase family 4 protein [Chthoniobacteraceae bacterium]